MTVCFPDVMLNFRMVLVFFFAIVAVVDVALSAFYIKGNAIDGGKRQTNEIVSSQCACVV